MRRLVLLLLAAVPLAGLTLAASPPAGASARPAARSVSASTLAAARTALKHLVIGRPSPGRTATHGAVHILANPNPVNSPNWAGYANDNTNGNKYDLVSGSWVQPAVRCPGAGVAAAAFWVGLDGFAPGSNTVEQDGTLAFCNGGAAMYFTWWEMFPNPSVIVGAAVLPGDTIDASVVLANGQYTLAVTDSTTPVNSFSVNQNCPGGAVCGDSSAEWIVEPPNQGGQLVLADFIKWSLTNAAVKSGNVLGTICCKFPADMITMVNVRNQVLAQPGALNLNSSAFDVTWKQGF